MFTGRPAHISREAVIDLPWPRDPADERVFAIERELRAVLADLMNSADAAHPSAR
jgi:hypothetical protein